MSRVVITGLGAVTPLGHNLRTSWDALISGKSGITAVESFDVSDCDSKIAGEVKWVGDQFREGWFDPYQLLGEKEVARMAKFCAYAMYATEEALSDANWKADNTTNALDDRTGVIIGSGIGGVEKLEASVRKIVNKERMSAFDIPSILVNMAAGNISIKYGFKGPSVAVVTACASGTHAIISAVDAICRNEADVMIAGGAESGMCAVCFKGFGALKALSTRYNDAPHTASRPWDKGRDGFVMGEGAGVMVLEGYDHAKARGAKIYAEILGCGTSSDAFHMTASDPTGSGARISMQNAMHRAKIKPSDIDYINAHGTSTAKGDLSEIRAIKSLFDDHISKLVVSSTKSSTGHLLGAAGALEAIFSVQTLMTGVIPPTLNLHDIEEECEGINLAPLVSQKKDCSIVLSNSFGFGGSNATLILGALKD